MSEKEVGKASSHLPTATEGHKSNDSVIIDIPESLEREVWSKCCIQRVPRRLRKVNEEAYTPQYVSIGPFHHGKPEFLGMEPHKRRYLDKFCKRTKKNQDDLTNFIRYHHEEIKHFTDFVRRALCPPESDNTGSDTGEESENRLSYLCSAKKLHSAGVQLFKSKNSRLADLDIKASRSFGVPCLKSTRLGLPEFCVEDGTECLLRNIMALEQCLYPQETYICDYICLLDQLINDTEDVELLVEKKIVRNLLGSNAEVAKLVNKLGEEIYYDDEKCYKEVCKKLNAHCNNWLNRTRATIKMVYFKDCWTGSTAIVGFFVLLFSISATIKALFFS